MRGSNGLAKMRASGSVVKIGTKKLPNGDDPLKIDIKLDAEGLPFSGELKDALPAGMEKKLAHNQSVRELRCRGRSSCRALSARSTHIVIVPRPESNVRLEVVRSPQPGIDPGGMIELPMENVHGRFVFDDGKVTMQDVNFQFRGAPVKFSRGTVFLEDSGRFDLAVSELDVKDIRFDLDLRKKMPPLMAQFALRLDDGNTFRPGATSRSAGRGTRRARLVQVEEPAGRFRRQHGQDRNPAGAHSRAARTGEGFIKRRHARGRRNHET